MVWGFATKELRDARDRVARGKYRAAALFVSNAKADIEDAPFDFGIYKDAFDTYHDEFQQEVETISPSEGHLNHCLDKLESFLQQMKAIRAAEDDLYNPE